MRRAFNVLAFTCATLTTTVSHAAPILWNSGTGNTGHWYEAIVVSDGITWDAAQADAIARGGYLATLLSAEENAFVFGLVDSATYWTFEAPTSNAYLGPWLGGYQPNGSVEPSGGWSWVNGDGAFSYTNWLGGEPTDGVGSPHGLAENVLHYFNYGTRASTWNDFPGSLARPVAYVVEYNQLPPAPVPEPATLLLLGTGLGAVAARRRLKKRA